MTVLGKVRLAPGQVGYYDELTRIHLIIARPEATVYEHMNRTNLKKSVKSGRLLLVSGSLDPETNIQQAPIVEVPAKTEIKIEEASVETKIEEPVTSASIEEPIKVEEAKIEEPVVETETETEIEAPIVEAVAEDAKEQEKKPASTSKSKSKKK